MSNQYALLDSRVQKWVYSQGWSDLRAIQKKAIAPLLACDCDVLITASTAAGKTEAFFLPACTAIADIKEGFGILYISPLKALINDQYRRLEGLCECLEMPVTPWHGDSLQSKKNQAKKHPHGILLITPESLESLLIREASWLRLAFKNLKYIVIDEFHVFIGSLRGQQLLSLLNRLEHVLARLHAPIVRVALSATLGQIETVPLSLRPNQSLPCKIIQDNESHSIVKVQVRGYTHPLSLGAQETNHTAEYRVCQDIYQFCRGDSHLVFANSRKRTESIAVQLSEFCQKECVPNEFFPHHGSLSKTFREDLESRLQKERIPTTAICTMTLELGIDIGKVNSVIQVTAPHSVSSLRQRMGRSGRRNTPSVLRMLISENSLTSDSSIIDLLRLELLQSLAMIRLLISNKWFEPADNSQYHFSTLLHQVLASLAQWGAIRAGNLYTLLCKEGPFQHISTGHFKDLLSNMGAKKLLTQLSSGELVLGIEGERLVSHFSFYSVFKTPDEYRLVFDSKSLGTLPIDSMLIEGEQLIFGAKRWKVINVDTQKRVIHVIPSKGGGQPPKFAGKSLSIHNKIRQEMLQIYKEEDYRIQMGETKVDFINKEAKALFQEGLHFFKSAQLNTHPIFQQGKLTYILPWLGDKIVNTLVALLINRKFSAGAFAGVIEVDNASVNDILNCFITYLQNGIPTETELAKSVPDKRVEKYDGFLSDALLCEGHGKRAFDVAGTKKCLKEIIELMA